MMVNFGAIIGESIRRTNVVLFRPFDLRKWLVLFFIATLAGFMYGSGCNLRVNNLGDLSDIMKKVSQKQSAVSSRTEKGSYFTDAVRQPSGEAVSSEDSYGETARTGTPGASMSSSEAATIAIVIVCIVVVLLVPIVILFIWLSSRFSFIFIENVIKNDCNIRLPFIAHGKIGNSLFRFRMAMLGILLLYIVIAIAIFMLEAIALPLGITKVLAIVFTAIVALVLFVGLCLIGGMMNEFGAAIMFKDKINAFSALRNLLSLFKVNIGNFVLYWLISFALAMVSLIAIGLIGLLIMVALVGPIAVLTLLWFGLTIGLLSSKLLFCIVFFPFILSGIILYATFSRFISLPLGVFFRTFGLKFFAAVDARYDLFSDTALQPDELAVEKEEFSPAVSGWLSFLVPGLGQIINGQVKKGVLIGVFFWLIIPWIYGIVDAYKTAKKLKAGEMSVIRPMEKDEAFSPSLAAILSYLLPGGGQIYNGQPGKGLLVFFTAWLVFPWIIGIRDAYDTAKRASEGAITLKRNPGFNIAALIIIGLCLIIAAVLFVILIIAAVIMSSQ